MSSDTKPCPICAEPINALAKKCKHCGEWLSDHTHESVPRGDQITTGDLSGVQGAAIGRQAQGISGHFGGSVIQAQGDVTLGRALRDEQYAIALNWQYEHRSMRGFDLYNRDLYKLKLENADLRRANLSEAYMRSIDLSNADVSRANLSGATLRKAVLRNADLGNSNLSKANLRRADLSHADLHKANLSEADLTMADLTGANLEGADLNAAKYDRSTKWPENFDPASSGAVEV